MFPETIALNENFGYVNNLQVIDPNGAPIPEVEIRVYYKTDFDNQQFTTPVGITITTDTGAWKNTLFVNPGNTYTIQFQKTSAFNPATIEITV